MKKVAQQSSPNVIVLGMADKEGQVKSTFPFLTIFYSGYDIRHTIHGWVDTDVTVPLPANWTASCIS